MQSPGRDMPESEHSPLPWRSVYPLGSKQRCAAVQAGDHYVYLNVFKPDDMPETIRMHQANADLIVDAVSKLGTAESLVRDLARALHYAADALAKAKWAHDADDAYAAYYRVPEELR